MNQPLHTKPSTE